VLLLTLFECLACLFIWWAGLGIVRAGRSVDRDWDMVQRRRRADWFRSELEQRPWWWLMLGVLMLLVLLDWFLERWWQPARRAAMCWTLAMIAVAVVVVTLTVHFGWGMRPIRV
jgi:hypothetical protein